MALSFYLWNRTAASNATADPAVNWAEGMAPSAVNDSARAMMASTAAFRDDISGAIVTGGSSTAYTITSYQIFDTLAHMNGAMVAFTPHATNGATVTLNVDGLGAKPLRPSPSVELLAGTLILGTPYVATYNNSDAAWYLQNFFGNPYNVPIGSGIPFFGATAPNSSFVFPYGQQISATTYSALYTVFGINRYGTDTGGNFYLPDLRGRTLAGKDDMGGSAASRLTSTYFGASAATLGATGGLESHLLTTPEIPSHTHVNTLTDPGHTHTPTGGGFFVASTSNNSTFGPGSSGVLQANTASATTGVTITNAAAGGGGAHAIVQPTIVCNYIMRVI